MSIIPDTAPCTLTSQLVSIVYPTLISTVYIYANVKVMNTAGGSSTIFDGKITGIFSNLFILIRTYTVLVNDISDIIITFTEFNSLTGIRVASFNLPPAQSLYNVYLSLITQSYASGGNDQQATLSFKQLSTPPVSTLTFNVNASVLRIFIESQQQSGTQYEKLRMQDDLEEKIEDITHTMFQQIDTSSRNLISYHPTNQQRFDRIMALPPGPEQQAEIERQAAEDDLFHERVEPIQTTAPHRRGGFFANAGEVTESIIPRNGTDEDMISNTTDPSYTIPPYVTPTFDYKYDPNGKKVYSFEDGSGNSAPLQNADRLSIVRDILTDMYPDLTHSQIDSKFESDEAADIFQKLGTHNDFYEQQWMQGDKGFTKWWQFARSAKIPSPLTEPLVLQYWYGIHQNDLRAAHNEIGNQAQSYWDYYTGGTTDYSQDDLYTLAMNDASKDRNYSKYHYISPSVLDVVKQNPHWKVSESTLQKIKNQLYKNSWNATQAFTKKKHHNHEDTAKLLSILKTEQSLNAKQRLQLKLIIEDPDVQRQMEPVVYNYLTDISNGKTEISYSQFAQFVVQFGLSSLLTASFGPLAGSAASILAGRYILDPLMELSDAASYAQKDPTVFDRLDAFDVYPDIKSFDDLMNFSSGQTMAIQPSGGIPFLQGDPDAGLPLLEINDYPRYIASPEGESFNVVHDQLKRLILKYRGGMGQPNTNTLSLDATSIRQLLNHLTPQQRTQMVMRWGNPKFFDGSLPNIMNGKTMKQFGEDAVVSELAKRYFQENQKGRDYSQNLVNYMDQLVGNKPNVQFGQVPQVRQVVQNLLSNGVVKPAYDLLMSPNMWKLAGFAWSAKQAYNAFSTLTPNQPTAPKGLNRSLESLEALIQQNYANSTVEPSYTIDNITNGVDVDDPSKGEDAVIKAVRDVNRQLMRGHNPSRSNRLYPIDGSTLLGKRRSKHIHKSDREMLDEIMQNMMFEREKRDYFKRRRHGI